jgi:hypothetical protein
MPGRRVAVIFPRTPRARQRYGRNKVIAVLVTFAVVYGTIKFVLPRGDFLARFQPGPRVIEPATAWEERWSGVVVGATGAVEAVLPDSLPGGGAAAGAPGATDALDTPARLARVRFRTEDDHPLVLLYDPAGAGPLNQGEVVSFLGLYKWTTGGGVVRAVAADSSAFGITRTGG